MIPIGKLEFNTGQIPGVPKNPRFIKDLNYKKLVKSMREFPELLELRELIVFPYKNKFVTLAGNQRLRGGKESKHGTMPCKVLSPKTAVKTLKRIVVMDNHSFGEDDWKLLEAEWHVGELKDWGKDLPSFMNAPVAGAADDNFTMLKSMKTAIKSGDLIEIGKHRLFCGDSSDHKNIKQLMNNETADLIFTDPPYKMGTNGGTNDIIGKMAGKTGRAIKHLCEFDPKKFLQSIPLFFGPKKMNAYIFCNKDLVPDYLNWGVANKYNFNILFWKKPNAIPMGGNHRPDVEYLLLFRNNAIWNNSLKGVSYSKCLEYSRENSTAHPTMKPIGLVGNEIQISSNVKSIIVDTFLGSGTTMVVCEQLNRICYAFEIMPGYCQIIIDRMLKLCPGIVIKVNGKPYKK